MPTRVITSTFLLLILFALATVPGITVVYAEAIEMIDRFHVYLAENRGGL
jgi:hypothetical protein